MTSKSATSTNFDSKVTQVVEKILTSSQSTHQAAADGMWTEVLLRDYGWDVKIDSDGKLTLSGPYNGYTVQLKASNSGSWFVRIIDGGGQEALSAFKLRTIRECMEYFEKVTSLLNWMHSWFEATSCDPHIGKMVYQAVMATERENEKAVLDAQWAELLCEYLGWDLKTQPNGRPVLSGDFESRSFEIKLRAEGDWRVYVQPESSNPELPFFDYYDLYSCISALRKWIHCPWWQERTEPRRFN